jgi:hypothetical protein
MPVPPSQLIIKAIMPRYVILKHDISGGSHFDFMLETGGALKTWSLPHAPEPGGEMEVKALGDHRLAYLEYEGPLTGDRGWVARWDRGTYEVEQQSASAWTVRLSGEKLSGRVLLRQISDTQTSWRFLFTP